MRKVLVLSCFLFLGCACAKAVFAQDAPASVEAAKAAEAPAHYYHLEFVVRELDADGKAINTRTYTTTVSTNILEQASIRAGARVPYATGPASASDPTIASQYSLADVGVNIDVRHMREIGTKLGLDLTAEIKSLASTSNLTFREPVFRQNRWQEMVLIPMNKSSIAFTSDDLDGKGSMQLLVTATPVQ